MPLTLPTHRTDLSPPPPLYPPKTQDQWCACTHTSRTDTNFQTHRLGRCRKGRLKACPLQGLGPDALRFRSLWTPGTPWNGKPPSQGRIRTHHDHRITTHSGPSHMPFTCTVLLFGTASSIFGALLVADDWVLPKWCEGRAGWMGALPHEATHKVSCRLCPFSVASHFARQHNGGKKVYTDEWRYRLNKTRAFAFHKLWSARRGNHMHFPPPTWPDDASYCAERLARVWKGWRLMTV